MPRLAKSLEILRSQVNVQWPSRNKTSDGWIGDTAHSSRKSDHNPNAAGVVQAIDITNDPVRGPDAGELAERLLGSKDPRIKYIISKKRIAASYATGGAAPWTWRPYTGANAHDKHCHISVVDNADMYDDTRPWTFTSGAGTVPIPPPSATTSLRRRMGKVILDFEARKDSEGHILLYTASDGSREIGGVNERYHAEKFRELDNLRKAGRHQDVENGVIDYILEYTDQAAEWSSEWGVEFFLRDCIYNRGPKGAARILQRALGVPDDGIVGPATRTALKNFGPWDEPRHKDRVDRLLEQLRVARESYEREVVGYRANLWPGLVNRWNKALAEARKFQAESGPIPPVVGGGGVIVGGGAAAGAAAAAQMDWWVIIFILAVCILVGVLVYRALKRRREGR